MSNGATAVAQRATPQQQLRGLLEKSRDQIAMALPRHLTPDRMIRVAMTAFLRTPELYDCDLTSVVGCVVQSSQLGLELDGILGHAYMVPFDNKRARRKEAQLIVGYKGYLALARRSGEVSSFFAHVVHENDLFEYTYGTDAKLVHKPVLANRGPAIAVYAVIKLRDGSSDFEVLGWEEIEATRRRWGMTRDGKPKNSPWNTHTEEMAKKTAIRRLAKRCPVSVEIQRAASLDEHADAGQAQHLAGDVGALMVTRSDAVAAQLGARMTDPGLEHVSQLVRELRMEEAEFLALVAAHGKERAEDLTPAQVGEISAHLEDLLAQEAERSDERAALEGEE
jgi:recombination protein RecT